MALPARLQHNMISVGSVKKIYGWKIMKGGRNCWEFKKCNYGPGGDKAYKRGMCVVAMETRLNGIHGGTNGGRACWVVENTNCEADRDTNFAQKYVSCMQCDFYRRVKEQEGEDLVSTENLIQLLR